MTTRTLQGVAVLGIASPLGDGAEDLDLAIQLALADGPRAVVCDLSNMLGRGEASLLEVIANAGRHVRAWPSVPVGVACPDPQVRHELLAHPLGRNLIVTGSLLSALTGVRETPSVDIERLHLAPHPTAPRASRNFITRTLLDWQLSRVIPFATLVVSELVSSSSVSAGTDIDLSVAWKPGALRIAVRDSGPGLLGQPRSAFDLHGRGLTVVAGLSRAFGVLPTADGGKVVWAVLDAVRPPPSPSRHRASDERQELMTTHGRRHG